MFFTKNINVSTIIIIIVTIIVIEKSHANECLNQITNVGKINKDFSGAEAFDYVYRFLTKKNIADAKIEGILCDYIDSLFEAAMKVYNENILTNPFLWCLKNKKKLKILYRIEEQCEKRLAAVFNKHIYNARDALEYAYYHIFQENYIIEQGKSSKFKKYATGIEYYKYMIETFFPYIANSPAQGPKEYCDNFDTPDNTNLTFPNTYNESPSNTVFSTDQHQAGSSSAQGPVEYWHSELPLESTSAAGEELNISIEDIPMSDMLYMDQIDNASFTQLSTDLHPPDSNTQIPENILNPNLQSTLNTGEINPFTTNEHGFNYIDPDLQNLELFPDIDDSFLPHSVMPGSDHDIYYNPNDDK